MELAKTSEYFRRRIMGTIPIHGASSFLGMHGWREEEGGGMDVIERQTRLAELLSSMLLKGIMFLEAGEVMGIAEEMQKEKVDFKGMSEEMKTAVINYQASMNKLKRAGVTAKVNGERMAERLKRAEEEKRVMEERAKKAEEEKKRIEEENRRLKEEFSPLVPVLQAKGIITSLGGQVTSLSSLPLSFSNSAKMKIENNLIIRNGTGESYETCLIGDALRNVSLFPLFLFSFYILSSPLWNVI